MPPSNLTARQRATPSRVRYGNANNVWYWQHIAAPDVCDGTSAVGESRHRIPGASVGQPTEPCLALPQGRPYSGFPAPAAPGRSQTLPCRFPGALAGKRVSKKSLRHRMILAR